MFAGTRGVSPDRNGFEWFRTWLLMGVFEGVPEICANFLTYGIDQCSGGVDLVTLDDNIAQYCSYRVFHFTSTDDLKNCFFSVNDRFSCGLAQPTATAMLLFHDILRFFFVNIKKNSKFFFTRTILFFTSKYFKYFISYTKYSSVSPYVRHHFV